MRARSRGVDPAPHRVFLLSPASSSGLRARQLQAGRSAHAAPLRTRAGAPLGEVFTFCSALYFRGKLAYAARFGRPPPGVDPALVITPTHGLWPAQVSVRRETLRRFAEVAIDAAEPRYSRPLARHAEALAAGAPGCEVVLLGSIASGKYVDVLLSIFGDRLLFPETFVGRGDMSRGGLLLRASRSGVELAYRPVAGAVRHGARPPKLPRPARAPRPSC